MNFKLVAICATIFIGLTIEYTSAAGCHWREADLCLGTLAVYGNIHGIIPSTNEEMKICCRYMKESHDCVKDFARNCMTEDLFDTGYVLVESTYLFYDKFCTPGSKTQKEWLENAPCMAKNFNKTRPCTDYALAGLENLSKIESKDRYPTLCCVFNNIMQCISQELRSNCLGDSDQMVRIMMRNILSDIPIVACKPFKAKSKQCIDLLPPPGTKSKGKESDSQLVQLLAEFLSV